MSFVGHTNRGVSPVCPRAAMASRHGIVLQLQVKQFIVDGYILKQIDDVPREFHLSIYDKCVEERTRAAALPGKGRLQGGQESSHVAALDDFIFPTLSELGTVYASPVLRGATASLLGYDYVMHPHRHMHSGMGGMDQNFHKDGHHVPMRHHRPRWIMGMYFCTDVTIEMVRRYCVVVSLRSLLAQN